MSLILPKQVLIYSMLTLNQLFKKSASVNYFNKANDKFQPEKIIQFIRE